jgi:hypothetical protein
MQAAFIEHLFAFKKWERGIKKTAAFAKGALIGYHLGKSEAVIPTNFYAGLERDIHVPTTALPFSSFFCCQAQFIPRLALTNRR